MPELFDRILSKPDFFWYLNYVLAFQINDLNYCVSGKANFLAAVGCMNTIEFLGGIRNGELGLKGKSASCFKEGVRLLGDNNGVRLIISQTEIGSPLLPIPKIVSVNEDMMWALRCGLTHQYLPKVKRVGFVFIGAGKVEAYRPFGIILRENGVSRFEPNMVQVDVESLIESIEVGCNKLFTELKEDEQKKLRAEKALSLVPELL